MDRYSSGFEVTKMAEVLGVSRSGYYAHQKRPLSARALENEKLVTLIRLAWGKSRQLYGALRIAAELHTRGLRFGKNRVARLMRQAGIRS